MAQKTFIQIESISSNNLIIELSKEFSKLLDEKLLKLQPVVDGNAFITRQEVAEMLSISITTVHSWMNCGILKPYKIGNKTRFLLSEVKAAATKNGSKEGGANE
jgi:excisionase family DNA binding protein